MSRRERRGKKGGRYDSIATSIFSFFLYTVMISGERRVFVGGRAQGTWLTRAVSLPADQPAQLKLSLPFDPCFSPAFPRPALPYVFPQFSPPLFLGLSSHYF